MQVLAIWMLFVIAICLSSSRYRSNWRKFIALLVVTIVIVLPSLYHLKNAVNEGEALLFSIPLISIGIISPLWLLGLAIYIERNHRSNGV